MSDPKRGEAVAAQVSGAAIRIDLGALAGNWRLAAGQAGRAECAAAVKADAYGTGIAAAVPALWRAGCRTFFVALPAEGLAVRETAPDAVVYVLNGALRADAELYRRGDLRPVLNTPEDIAFWRQAGGGRPAAIHADTGMNRLGLSLHDCLELARHPETFEALAPALLMSHLCCADEAGHPMNAGQLALFREVARVLPGVPLSLANSAGIFLGAPFQFDVVRPGIALYGGWSPSNGLAGGPAFAPVVTLSARVVQVREAEAGATVGYGGAQRLARATRLAILSVGYGDGLLRAAGSSDEQPGAYVYLRGAAAPVVGRVSMDVTTVDVTDVPGVVAGDWAELFGTHVPIETVAAAAGTISYEVLTRLGPRAARSYIASERESQTPGASA